jgi:uncharacterized protein (DUF1778 family)
MNKDDTDVVTIILTHEDFQKFQEILARMPPEPSDELRKLMASSAPWNKLDA